MTLQQTGRAGRGQPRRDGGEARTGHGSPFHKWSERGREGETGSQERKWEQTTSVTGTLAQASPDFEPLALAHSPLDLKKMG